MKKLFLLSILFTTVCFAQVPRRFYLVALGNQANINTNAFSAEPGMGYGAGLAFNWGYHETFNYEVEALYNRYNFKMDYIENIDETTTATGQDKVFTETIDVKFNMNYYFIIPEEDKFYMGALGGVFTSISNGSWEFKEYSDNKIYGDKLTQSSFQTMPKMNYGVNFGLVMGYNDLRIALKYNLGLSNALSGVENNSYDESNSYKGPSFDGKFNSLTLGLYYKI